MASRTPPVLRLLGLALLAGCVEAPEPSSICEELSLKLSLCGLSKTLCEDRPASCECRVEELDERERCETRCVLQATCDDFADSFEVAGPVGADVRECLDTCRGEDGEFVCDDGERINVRRVCDGAADCTDRSDEAGCR